MNRHYAHVLKLAAAQNDNIIIYYTFITLIKIIDRDSGKFETQQDDMIM